MTKRKQKKRDPGEISRALADLIYALDEETAYILASAIIAAGQAFNTSVLPEKKQEN